MKGIDKKAGQAAGFLLALVLIFSQIAPITVFADTTQPDAVFTVGSTSAAEGNTFSVPVLITDCPDFWAMGLKVLFEDDIFELQGISLHENVSPDSGYTLQPPDLNEGLFKILAEGDADFAFADGPILLLTFKAKDDVMTDDYLINLEVDENNPWINADEEKLAGTFNPGTISVTGITGEAEYKKVQYPTIREALEEAASDPGATVKVLRDVTISDASDRLIIPSGADIKLDLNGKTIKADYTGGHLIHIEEGGKLNLSGTLSSLARFISSSKPAYSDTAPAGLSFLLNEGTLAMSRIVVLGFWQGVVDGRIGSSAVAASPYSGKGGSILKIEDCQFDTVFTALGLGGSTVGTLKNSTFVSDAYPMALGHLYYGTAGGIESIEDSTIQSRRYSDLDLYGSLYIDYRWTVSQIKNTVIADHKDAVKVDREAGALMNLGTIELLTSSSYSEKYTRIEASYRGIENVGTIDLIDGAKTRISGHHAMTNGCLPELNLVAEVKEIRGGQFISSGTGGALHIFQSKADLTPTVHKISGGIFQAGSKYAVTNAGLLGEVTGGRFYGPELALKSAVFGMYSSVTGGYYKTGEVDLFDEEAYNAIPFSKGYGISTLPLQGGENAGYYHVGPAVSITWLVEDLDDRHDIFIVGDPVYYFAGTPEAPDGKFFKGWFDGKKIYKPESLPVAGVDTIYLAVFGDADSETDPLILVGSDIVMAGDTFSIPVVIEDCPAFQTMGLELSFDDDVFELMAVTLHPDRVADSDHSLDVDLGEARMVISKEGSGDMAFENGPFLLLTFKAAPDAQSDDYFIELAVSEDLWKNSEDEELEGTFVPGLIELFAFDVDYEAFYAGTYYPKVQEAIEAASSGGPKAKVYLLKDIEIDDSVDRLVIPEGADIILNMQGRTMTAAFDDQPLIHVEAGGKLTLTSPGPGYGRFIYHERPEDVDDPQGGSAFLLNEGILAMNRIEVKDFWQGVVDGLFVSSLTPEGLLGQAGGAIRHIEDCEIDTVFTALGLGGSLVSVLKNSRFAADAVPLVLGNPLIESEGEVESLDGTTILSRYESDHGSLIFSLFIGPSWTVSEIKDTVIGAHEEANQESMLIGLLNHGTIGTITSSPSGKHTRIGTEKIYYAIDNEGTIGLIDGANTQIVGRLAMLIGPRLDSSDVGNVTEIRDGQFIGGRNAIVIMAGDEDLKPAVHKISGGIFQAGENYAVTNAGLLGEVTGGRFYGPELALKSAVFGMYSSVTGGYYKTDEVDLFDEEAYNAIPFSKGYGISTLPLQGGENAGYYHVGPAVSITWLVEDLDDRHDIFIVGDPVYYFAGTPEAPDGKFFKGWFDGKKIYKPESLPVAGVDTIYLAVFGDADSETDPLILVGSDIVMAGDTFSIPVVIEDCPAFQTMGLELSFDDDVFELMAVTLHPDRVADSDHSLDVDLGEARMVISKEGSGDMAFENGPFLLLTFKAAPDAQSDDYFIELAVSEDLWKNSEDEELEGTFVPGLIELFAFDVDYEAFYAGTYYPKVQEAIEAASSGGPKAKVYLLKDIEIDDSVDRLVIPEGADIILNMQGRTMTAAFDDQPLIHVEAGGKLTLTSPGPGYGRFIYHERPEDVDDPQGGSAFLLNEGILAMNRIEVKDFWQGVVDGLFVSSLTPEGLLGQAGGAIRHIEDCEIDTVFTALGLGGSLVSVLKNSRFAADAVPLVLGNPLIESEGEVESLDGTTILSRYESDHGSLIFSLFIGPSWTVSEIKDTVIGAHEEANQESMLIGLLNHGTIGTITSSPSGKHTRIGTEKIYYVIDNEGTIGLIDGANTQIVGRLAMVNSSIPEQNLVAEVMEICDGQFIGGRSAIVIMAGDEDLKPAVHKISGGIFQSNYRYAVVSAGLLEEVTGGRFYGPELALKSAVFGMYSSVTGGYYKTDEVDLLDESAYNAIPFSEGYGISTLPLLEGENAGYYHVGPAVSITWLVEGLDDRQDIFIEGDPVYYFAGKPEVPQGQFFKGWFDGSKTYQPQELPIASVPVIYTALFGDLDPEDYKVILESVTADANAGDEFTVDVKVTSQGNPTFFGATVDVLFDASDLEYQAGSSVIPQGFSVLNKGNGMLQIVGAFVKEGEATGFAIDPDDGFILATLSFKVKLDVATGPTDIEIGDGPVVDLLEAVGSQLVSKGDDLEVNLRNLKVTFKAGDHVDLTETYAYVKYKEAGLYTLPGYETPFTEPAPTANVNYTLDDPLWKPEVGDNMSFAAIGLLLFEEDATFTATASESQFKLHYDTAYVTPKDGVGDEDAITYKTDVTFTVQTPKYGFKIKDVTYRVGDDGTEMLLAPTDDLYTIPGDKITDHVWVTVTDEVDADEIEIVLISNEIYNGLPNGFQLMEVRIPEKLLTDQAFAFDGVKIFYSSKYSEQDASHNIGGKQVYIYAIPSDLSEEGARAKLDIVVGSNEEVEASVSGNFDVNMDGRVNSTDVVLAYGLYKGFHLDKTLSVLPSLLMRLRADINGDRTVDTQDAQAILGHIWGY